MNDLKFYAKFIHKLLGGDNDILHCDLISNVSLKILKIMIYILLLKIF